MVDRGIRPTSVEFRSIKCPPDHHSPLQWSIPSPRPALSVILRTNLSRPNFFSARDQNLWQDGWCRQIDSVAFIQSKDSPPKPPQQQHCYMGPWRKTATWDHGGTPDEEKINPDPFLSAKKTSVNALG